jgi:hypothetical protein
MVHMWLDELTTVLEVGFVLRRFRESIPDDSILLTIFAVEREDSSKMSRN